MCSIAVNVAVFLVACLLAWQPGNYVSARVWRFLTQRPLDDRAKFGPQIGGLERVLYVFSAMAGHYELVAGWLVMKAFFGWTERGETNPAERDTEHFKEVLERYNRFLIGNMVSLLIGLGVGLAAKFFADLWTAG